MSEDQSFDLVIIGAGPGGYSAAIRAAQRGLKTALVDKRERLGGTCLNIGCIPSKALLDSSERYWSIRTEVADHGITIEQVGLDLSVMMERKRAVVDKLTSGVRTLMKQNNVSVFRGIGTIESPGTVRVEPVRDDPGGSDAADKETGSSQSDEQGRTLLHAESIVLATGSKPQTLPFLKPDGRVVVTSEEALAFESVPDRLVVVGAGAVGLELGSVWARLGSEVTVVELMHTILPGWDTQVARMLKRPLEQQGLEIKTGTKITEAKIGEDTVTLIGEDSEGSSVQVAGDAVLVAVGRRAAIPENAEDLGIELHQGRITVDDAFRTSVPGVYAIGDLINGPMLAHKAEEDGIACVDILSGRAAHVDYNLVPNVVYVRPEAASVGRTEEELKDAEIPYQKGSFRFGANGRALAMGEPYGVVKILAHEDSDEILGAHIVGPWASTLIAEIAGIMAMSGSAEDIAATVHAHPTLPEAVREAALAVSGMAIHSS